MFRTCYVFDLRAGVGRGGWGGLMTSMRMRPAYTVSLSAPCIGGEGGMGGHVDDVDVVLHNVDCLCGR